MDNLARIYKQRFCRTCLIQRPPFSSHCQKCDQCVSHFDHHCYLMNNCIGLRNKRSFIYFINSAFLTTLLFTFGYLFVILQDAFESNSQMTDQEKESLRYRILLMMVLVLLTEVAADFLRVIVIPSSVIFVYFTATALFEQHSKIDIALLFMFLVKSMALGSTIQKSITYAYLIF